MALAVDGAGRDGDAAGQRPAPGLVDVLLADAADVAARAALERRERRRVASLGRPTYDLPFLPDGVDLGGLYVLAQRLVDQGAG